MQSRKYKTPLKPCTEDGGCKYLKFVVNEDGSKTYFCNVTGSFVNQCERRILKKG